SCAAAPRPAPAPARGTRGSRSGRLDPASRQLDMSSCPQRWDAYHASAGPMRKPGFPEPLCAFLTHATAVRDSPNRFRVRNVESLDLRVSCRELTRAVAACTVACPSCPEEIHG